MTAATGLTLFALTVTAPAAASPMISQYALEDRGAQPLSIVTGPEGNLWFTETGGTKAIGRISPVGVITSFKTGSSEPPHDIARGPYGNLWFTAGGATGELDAFDPFTEAFHEYALPPAANNPVGLTSGPEGDIWFAVEGGPEALVGRIAPSTGEISEFKVPTKNGRPANITVGPEGDLWFTESGNPGAIGRFDPKTKGFSEFSKGLTVNSAPSGITTGPEGDIWFTEATRSGRVGRLDPTSGAISEFSAGLTAGTPEEITRGRDGNLYFTESGGQGALAQVTPAGVITEYTAGLTPQAEPWGITAGPEGNIWFTERASPARIGVLDLASPLLPPAVSPPASDAPQPSGPGGAAVDPVLGRSAGVERVSGTILVKSPSSGRFVLLASAATVPIGTVIDAAHGVLRLVTALPGGATQSAVVWDGSFRVAQRASGDGTTKLILSGALPRCAAARHARASAARARQPRARKLWAQDQHGRYSSYGAYSATTVMGTRWETLDSCAGTLTRVAQGEVRVHDFERHATVIVRAGHSYLARA